MISVLFQVNKVSVTSKLN